jgi:cystathionine beta-lyase/cystathionine gamma-synthase
LSFANTVGCLSWNLYLVFKSEMQMKLDEIINILGEEDLSHKAIVPPIYQTSNFQFDTVAKLRSAFSDEWSHHLYSRGNNPTVAVLRKKLAALEGTEDALCFSSGIAAISAAILAQVEQGDHIICVNNPYSWTSHLLKNYLPKFGINTTFVDGKDNEAIEAAYKLNTRLLVLESPNTMSFELQDLEWSAKWAKEHNIITVVDNSYASPIYQQPHSFGIDIIVHSGSKYINGHSDVVCGILCASHQMVASIVSNEYMTLGAIMSPIESYLVLRGMRTLPVRMSRIDQSTQQVFEFLKSHSLVEKLFYPFDPDNSQYNLAKRQMSGCPGLISIQITANDQQIERFIEELNIFKMAVSWGGYESLILPILAAYGIEGRSEPYWPRNHIRLYIGLEDPMLLIEDLSAALEVIEVES